MQTFTFGSVTACVRRAFLVYAAAAIISASAFAQTTSFSYQGTLHFNGVPANGTFDLQFKLFDSLTGGTQQGSTVTRPSVQVANGVFAVTLDFGNLFPGTARYLEIGVQPAGGGGYTLLSPRQQILSAPYAILAQVAATALTANSLSGPQTTSSSTSTMTFTNNQTGITPNSGTPPAGVIGNANSPSGQTIGVFGNSVSTNGIGVLGSTDGAGGGGAPSVGVFGVATSTTGPANGVMGETSSSNGWGVYGNARATTGPANGVVGDSSSPNGSALLGRSFGNGDILQLNSNVNGGNPKLRVLASGDLVSLGNINAANGFRTASGSFSTGGTPAAPNFEVISNGNVAMNGNLRLGGPTSSFSLGGTVATPNFSVNPVGNVRIEGDLSVGGSKNNFVGLPDGRSVLLYANESPEYWFEDFGTVKLKNGRAIVNIDPTFAQTVNTEIPYKVFLTPNGDTRGLYVTRKSATSFEVRESRRGRSNVSFDYRIVAKRRGWEKVRFEPAERLTVQN